MQLEEIERPSAGRGEVLVEVAAAGVGPWDAYGQTNPRFVGGYAEFAVCDAAMVALKPRSLDYVAAASIPVVAVTAWQALFEHARLKAGDVVLILGANGNVGGYATQFARQAGIRVLEAATGLDRVDAVIDLVGGEAQTRSLLALRRGGRLISAVSPPDAELATTLGVEAKLFLVHVDTARLNEIAAMVDAGALSTNVGCVLPLTDAVAAHEMLAGVRPHPRGKIVLALR